MKVSSGFSKEIKGFLNMSSIQNIKYKYIKIEITNSVISFYCLNNSRVFYNFSYYRNQSEHDKDLDLYRALIDFDEKIISDILDPILISKNDDYTLIKLSNDVNSIIESMVM